MISLTDIRGSREEKGSWKIICISRRSRNRSSPLAWVMSLPPYSTCPPLASSRPRMTRPRVDLPQPDSPTTPRVWPFWMEKLTPSTAWRVPAAVLKYFFSSCTRMSSSMGRHLLSRLRPVAADKMSRSDLGVRRALLPADIAGAGTAGAEAAPLRQVGGVRHQAGDGL